MVTQGAQGGKLQIWGYLCEACLWFPETLPSPFLTCSNVCVLVFHFSSQSHAYSLSLSIRKAQMDLLKQAK